MAIDYMVSFTTKSLDNSFDRAANVLCLALANPAEQEVPSPEAVVRHPQLRHQRSAETHPPRQCYPF